MSSIVPVCRIPTTLPNTLTVGGHQQLNNFSDLLREEIARAGYTEMLTHGLCSREENFKVMLVNGLGVPRRLLSGYEFSRNVRLRC